MPASNTYDTTNLGSAVANTEDLTRGAHLISPENSPLYSTLDKEQATATFHEWILDDLAAPDDTGIIEGADAESFEDAFGEQARVGNYLMTIERTAKVTDDQELVDNAGGVNFAGAIMKKLKELNRDVEKRLCSTTARDPGSKSTARQAAGFGEMLGGSSTVFPAEYETPASSISSSAVSESVEDGIIRSIFNESGERPNLRLYGDSQFLADLNAATMRLNTTGTDGAAQRVAVNLNGEKGALKFRVRIYESQHGAVEVFDLNPQCTSDTANNDTAFYINPAYACVAELGGLIQKELPDLGGGRRVLLRRKFCPVVKNPRAHGYRSAS